LAFGLLNAVYPAAALLDETYAFVHNLIATVSPNSLRQTRWQVYRDLHRDVGSAVRDSEGLIGTMMREPDYAEGVRAFIDKRDPNWTGDSNG
jgi:enoyl-CoA hydratase/carnithine racemase